MWCFVAPSSHWKFWKKIVALIKLSLFWFEFNYHFPRQRPYPISTPMDRENYTQVFIICCRVTTWFTAGPEFVVWTPCVPQPLSTEDKKTSRSTCSTEVHHRTMYQYIKISNVIMIVILTWVCLTISDFLVVKTKWRLMDFLLTLYILMSSKKWCNFLRLLITFKILCFVFHLIINI